GDTGVAPSSSFMFLLRWGCGSTLDEYPCAVNCGKSGWRTTDKPDSLHSFASHGHAVDEDRSGQDVRTRIDVAADCLDARIHVAQVRRDRDFLDRIRDLAVL